MTVVWDTIDLNTIHGNGTRSSRGKGEDHLVTFTGVEHS